MNTKMYVGNLPFDVTELQLRELFATQGEVSEVAIVMDNYSNRPRGFAFVTMKDPEGMQNAIRQLDGKEFMGRALKINEARPRENRENRPAYGGGGGGGGGRGRGGGGGGGSRKGHRSNDRW